MSYSQAPDHEPGRVLVECERPEPEILLLLIQDLRVLIHQDRGHETDSGLCSEERDGVQEGGEGSVDVPGGRGKAVELLVQQMEGLKAVNGGELN